MNHSLLTDLLTPRRAALTALAEVINGRLEHLRGTASGVRNLTYDIARSLIETGGSRRAPHPRW